MERIEKMKKAQLIILTMLMAPLLAFSQGEPINDGKNQAVETSKSATATMSEGEIRKINLETGKVTIKHGPLVNLDMPGMTMLFRLRDAAMLDQIKEGDKIKFIAEKIDGVLVVTTLQAEK